MRLQGQKDLSQEPDNNRSSIWDWTPPGDLAETGAWKVLRELAMTLTKYAQNSCPNRHDMSYTHNYKEVVTLHA